MGKSTIESYKKEGPQSSENLLFREEKEVIEAVSNCDIVKEPKEWNLEELENILKKSIKKTGEQALKENNGVIYTTLSGGIDSSLCTAILREVMPAETRIVTFSMGGKNHPDLRFASMIAQTLQTEHHKFIPTMEQINKAKGEFAGFGEMEARGENFGSGDVDVFLLYKLIKEKASIEGGSFPVAVMAHDGIDELMGGYWAHRGTKTNQEKSDTFKDLWQKLPKKHLENLSRSAALMNIKIIWPYLDRSLIEYISHIPLDERTSKQESKMPLRAIAKKYLPQEIIERRKRGQVGMTDTEI
ncbi:MAG: asparagine synthase-related protein [Candidatus Omnitrophota bacterium]|nr:asparagine synthase-related protein [Candidatus Omnitrophota bacterium]